MQIYDAYLAKGVVVPLQRWNVIWKVDLLVFLKQWPMKIFEGQPVLQQYKYKLMKKRHHVWKF